MLQADLVILVCLVYVAILFAVAFAGDRRARKDTGGWLSSPLVYTLSMSIYCTTWTFFGAVGSATRSGIEFVTIYVGPMIVVAGWWIFLRKLVTVGRIQHTTSIADFISARFGKNPALGALVTLIAVVAAAPYIALQLKALTEGFRIVTASAPEMLGMRQGGGPDYGVALWVAGGLCVFSIMFGVRNIDVNERHHGVIAAIALEAAVKLAALIAVGTWALMGSGSPEKAIVAAPGGLIDPSETFGLRWVTLCFLSGAAIFCLPRQFQVTVVENSSERQIRTASWLFPLYVFLISLFVPVIAAAGLHLLPENADPDLYVLTLPLSQGQNALALFVLLGGFSSATSMVIVSSIALSTMISNHIIMPLALRFSIVPMAGTHVMRSFILGVRRASIIFIIALGFVYFWLSGNSDALAAIGLISFCGVAQFLPSLVGGLYWRRATHRGALAGLVAGFAIWAYTLFLPSFEGALSQDVIRDGLFGWAWLRPYALFGLAGLDPLVHAVFWSLFCNVVLFVGVSLLSEPTPLARVQSTLFIDVFRRQTESELGVIRRTARVSDLRAVADRVLGHEAATVLLRQDGGPEPTAAEERGLIAGEEMITLVERRLAAHIGAASARSLVSRVVTDETISVEELKRLAGETEQIRAYSVELERKSRQLEAAAAELSLANARLREMDVRKDEFLSQVSHEVRTPMTSIRSFSDILMSSRGISEKQRHRFLGIIHNESLRLTRLLDSILDLNHMQHGEPSWEMEDFDPESTIDQAVESCEALAHSAGVALERGGRTSGCMVAGNSEKLAQVVINLVSNAIRYNSSAEPKVRVSSAASGAYYEVRVADNGPGIAAGERERIFTKFTRGKTARDGGTGLGLAISRRIADRMGGELFLAETENPGAEFVLRLPLRREAAGEDTARDDQLSSTI